MIKNTTKYSVMVKIQMKLKYHLEKSLLFVNGQVDPDQFGLIYLQIFKMLKLIQKN